MEKYKRRKNLIIIAPLNSTSVTSQFIKSVTDSVIINKFKSEEDFTLIKYDLWAKDQIVMILSAPTMQALEFKILKEKVEQSRQDIVLTLFHARFPIERRLETWIFSINLFIQCFLKNRMN